MIKRQLTQSTWHGGLRDLKFATRNQNKKMGYVQPVGQIQQPVCGSYAGGAGVYTICITDPEFLNGACTNCHHGGMYNRCSFWTGMCDICDKRTIVNEHRISCRIFTTRVRACANENRSIFGSCSRLSFLGSATCRPDIPYSISLLNNPPSDQSWNLSYSHFSVFQKLQIPL